jgi:methionine aminopeptidase
MNVDVTVFLDGYHGDTSRTVAVGSVVGSITYNYRLRCLIRRLREVY